jgi:hypothetical protein
MYDRATRAAATARIGLRLHSSLAHCTAHARVCQVLEELLGRWCSGAAHKPDAERALTVRDHHTTCRRYRRCVASATHSNAVQAARARTQCGVALCRDLNTPMLRVWHKLAPPLLRMRFMLVCTMRSDGLT